MRRVLAIAVFYVAAAASAAEVSVDDYIASLEEIRSLLASKQIARAQEKARALAAFDIKAPEGTFHADTALLHRVAKSQRDDIRLQEQITTTVEELRRASPSTIPPVDQKLLSRVAEDQAVAGYVEGGELQVRAKGTSLFDQVLRSIAAIFAWIGDKLGRIFDWILDLVPRSGGSRARTATGGMSWIVTALVTAIVLLIVLLAIEVTRRSRAAAKPVVAASAPIGSKRDEDPLSRGVSEWERYAAQLAADGRFREAIRAWYHAVLVTCYAAGILHYRKSRTNWEYVAALAPSLPWRGEMISLTQRFEREWYGADQSSQDALEDCAERARSIIDAIRLVGRGAA